MIQNIKDYKKITFYILIDFDVSLKEKTSESYYIYKANSLNSVFYENDLINAYVLDKITYDHIFQIITLGQDFDYSTIFHKIFPKNSQHLLIDLLLSLNITILYSI